LCFPAPIAGTWGEISVEGEVAPSAPLLDAPVVGHNHPWKRRTALARAER